MPPMPEPCLPPDGPAPSRDLARLAGCAMMVDLPGTELTQGDADFLRSHGIRAICLFRRNVATAEQTRRLTADLKAALGEEVLIGIDQEGGAVMRTVFLPEAPSAMALGAADDEPLARQVGAAVARGLGSLGINWNFAPVLDLNSNPRNPVIGERSFGSDPARVAKLAGAWLQGHVSEGVAACLKHFPGHGDTGQDSHLDLPRVDKTLGAIEQLELQPFRALASQAPSLMSAHIVFGALDPALPATLSPAALQHLLRDQWGFRGVAITDGMNMKAIRDRWGQARGSVLALKAGADLSLVLEFREEMVAAWEALQVAVAHGDLDLARLVEAEARTMAMAGRFPAGVRPYPAAQEAQDRGLFATAWARALTTVGGTQRPPLGGRVRLVVQREAPSDGVSEAGLPAEALIAGLAPLYELEVVQFQQREELDWGGLPADGRFTLLASTTRERYASAQSATWRPDLHLALWNPYAAGDLPCPALVTYGFAKPALDAVLGWLKGESNAPGRPPVDLEPRAH